MLKKLRRKFIALNVGTVAVVLLVALAAIGILSWQQDVAEVNAALDNALAQASQVQGKNNAPDNPAPQEGEGAAALPEGSAGSGAPVDEGADGKPVPGDASEPSSTNEAPSSTDAASEADDTQGQPPELGAGNKRESLIPVAVYRIGEDEAIEVVSGAATAQLATDTLQQAQQELASAGDGSGSLDSLGLLYLKRSVGGAEYYAFASAASASGWQSTVVLLIGIAIAALFVFWLISLVFSRWALRPVQNAWTQQRQFVADASHELKTPLTVILANMSIALKHPGETIQQNRTWLEGTRAEAERMKALVQDMLDLAKLDARVQPEFTTVDFSRIVEGCVLQFESLAFERGVQLEQSVKEGLQIKGNEPQLVRLVGTLVDNACKYAGKGGLVSVKLGQVGRTAKLSVKNTGASIPAEELPHVFDRFWRADKARQRSDGSYGLGLAIARSIAEEHKGAIEAASSEAQGTVFTVTVPLA